MVLVQKWPFFQLFLGNVGQENVFYDILECNQAFHGYRTSSKSQQNSDFSKEGNPWFCSKNGHFLNCFLFQAIQAKNICVTIFKKKIPLQAIKTRSTKSRQIKIFPKGLTHGFGAKMVIFSNFFLQAIQARKMSFMIFQNEKTPFQAIKTRS